MEFCSMAKCSRHARSAGDQVRFQLLQAANPIEQQPDFEIREASDHSALRCKAAAGAGSGHSAIVFALTPIWKR
jgi:hypothetical protein